MRHRVLLASLPPTLALAGTLTLASCASPEPERNLAQLTRSEACKDLSVINVNCYRKVPPAMPAQSLKPQIVIPN